MAVLTLSKPSTPPLRRAVSAVSGHQVVFACVVLNLAASGSPGCSDHPVAVMTILGEVVGQGMVEIGGGANPRTDPRWPVEGVLPSSVPLPLRMPRLRILPVEIAPWELDRWRVRPA